MLGECYPLFLCKESISRTQIYRWRQPLVGSDLRKLHRPARQRHTHSIGQGVVHNSSQVHKASAVMRKIRYDSSIVAGSRRQR